MRSVLLGASKSTGQDVYIPTDAFSTHFHLIGGTGKGKTTAIHTMLQPLLRDGMNRSCFFIVDRLGNFSQELLLWMASHYCPQHVRDRLVYIQPSNEDYVATFNPLQYDTPAHGQYKVDRATEIILRAWESVNIEAMPRLARWTFNSFWAAAQMNLTIADCRHLLMPGSQFHAAILQRLPHDLQAEWREIMGSRSGEAMKILDSSRNRLRPYFDYEILRRMFGSRTSRLDVQRFMREGKIILLDLAPRNRLSTQQANTIGALLINEILAVARSLPRDVRYPTYLLLDEFQNFVGPDIEAALPEVRQLGLRLILSHQSLSQLKRGDHDLTSMIFQAQSRLIFGVQGEDADILANELASLTFDSRKVKDEFRTRRQLIRGHRITELQNFSETDANSSQWSRSQGSTRTKSNGDVRDADDWSLRTRNEGESDADNSGTTDSSGSSHSTTRGRNQVLVPEYDEFFEVSSRTYESFDEQRSLWARDVRNLSTGQALLRLVNDPTLYPVHVRRPGFGFLSYDAQTIARRFPRAYENVDRLIEHNYRDSGIFVSAQEVDRESDERMQKILSERIVVPAANGHRHRSNGRNGHAAAPNGKNGSHAVDPFA